MVENIPKNPDLEQMYLDLFADHPLSFTENEDSDLRQPLWGKVVPSITSINSAVKEP